MPIQTLDLFTYKDNKYNVLGLNGKGLLVPQDFGMSPIPFSTGCMRGYYLEHTCIEENLVLTALSLQIDEHHEYKEIQGVLPVGDTECYFVPPDKFATDKYHNLKIPVSYSGGFLIAKGYIRELHLEILPQGYETVFELLFDHGELVKAIDWSELVARDRNDAIAHKPDYFEVKFSLEYDLGYFYHMNQYAR